MDERRSRVRIVAGIEGTCQILRKLQAPRLEMTQDLSLGGARFFSTEALEAGERVRVTLALPREGPVDLTGLVVWSRPVETRNRRGYEAGLRWAQADPHAQARLNAFVSDWTRAPGPQVIPSVPVSAREIRWYVVLPLALILWMGLSRMAGLWFDNAHLYRQTQTLRSLVQDYQGMLNRLLR